MNNAQVIELHNQRLLTTEQLAEFYEAATNQIKQNYGRNKEKFIEGKHFYLLEGEELKAFKSQVTNSHLPISKFASQLYLWTKRGASRHSKILNTDKAWDTYDELEENYFNPKPVVDTSSLSLELQLMQGFLNQLGNHEQELKRLNAKIDSVADSVVIHTQPTIKVASQDEKVLYTTLEIGSPFGYVGTAGANRLNKLLHEKRVIYPKRSLSKLRWFLYANYRGTGLKDESTIDVAQKWTAKGKAFVEDILKGEL